MLARCLVALLLTSRLAAAAPAAPGKPPASKPAKARPIHDLPVVPVKLTINAPEIQGPYVTIELFRVIAPSPIVTAQINRQIAADARALGGLERHQPSADSGLTGSVTCTAGFTTDVLVSWLCRGEWLAIERGGGGPGTAGSASGGAYFIEGDQLRKATPANLLVANADLSTVAGTDGCHPADDEHPIVSDEGIEYVANGERRGCLLPWDALTPLLAPNLPFDRIAERNAAGADTAFDPALAWARAAPRFVVEGDAVRDKATDLLWAARDNGADLDWAAAAAYAHAYRGGGNDDWRLPTEDELETLAEPVMAHRDKTDCTKGKNAVVITPLIHLSCGLAWSSSKLTHNRAVAFGFISGTSRAAKLTERKNYRALVVRTAR